MIQCGACRNYFSPGRELCPVCGAALPLVMHPDTSATDRAAQQGIRQGVVIFFVMFLVQIFAPLAVGVFALAFLPSGPGMSAAEREAASTLLVAFAIVFLLGWFFVSVVAPLVGWLPRWLLLAFILPLPVLAIVYFCVVYQEIMQLPTAYRIMGWIGCTGFAVIGGISVIGWLSAVN